MVGSVCPGKYCGLRTESTTSNNSFCGPCHWGSRVNPTTYQCEPCREDGLLWHDCMYLTFVSILPGLIHAFYHEVTIGRLSTTTLWPIHYVYLLLETTLAAVITLVVMPPVGSFHLYACGVREFSDWYPLFSNPTIRSQQTLHCSHEVVYPLYSLPFVLFGIWFIFSVVFRPIFGIKLKSDAIGAIGPSLYFCPLIVIGHATFAGLIYYSFPYIILVTSLAITAVLLANLPEQTTRGLMNAIRHEPRQSFLLVALLFLKTLGILSLFDSVPELNQLWLFLFLPAPIVFYIVTAPFTDPAKVTVSIT